MNSFFWHLLVSTILFITLYAFYIFFLRRLTFHTLNRWALLSIMPISLVLPFTRYLPSLDNSEMLPPEIFTSLNFYQNTEIIDEVLTTEGIIDYSIIFISIYITGVLVMNLRFFRSINSLFLKKKNSFKLQKNGYELVHSDVNGIHSFFKWIFVPTSEFKEINPIILEHEKAHVKLKHSIDIILFEIYSSLFWFNPLVYRYGKSLKSIHEFQADRAVLIHSKVKKSTYLRLMLSIVESETRSRYFCHFSDSIIYKRIEMISSYQSKKNAVYNYLFYVSIVLFSFAFLSFTSSPNNTIDRLNKTYLDSFSFPLKNMFNSDSSTNEITGREKENNSVVTKDEGVDILVSKETPVSSVFDGKVVLAKSGVSGGLVIIKHSNGVESRYAHLNRMSVRYNQVVKKGELIGYTGGTYGDDYKPVMHFEMIKNGKPINPLDLKN